MASQKYTATISQRNGALWYEVDKFQISSDDGAVSPADFKSILDDYMLDTYGFASSREEELATSTITYYGDHTRAEW